MLQLSYCTWAILVTRSSYWYQDICPCDLGHLWKLTLSGAFVFHKHILFTPQNWKNNPDKWKLRKMLGYKKSNQPAYVCLDLETNWHIMKANYVHCHMNLISQSERRVTPLLRVLKHYQYFVPEEMVGYFCNVLVTE